MCGNIIEKYWADIIRIDEYKEREGSL